MELERLIQIESETAPATQEIFQAVDEMIKKHQLTSEAALNIVSHLSANLIHSLQKDCEDAASKDAIEDRFHRVLDCYLAAYDQMDIKREMKKMMN